MSSVKNVRFVWDGEFHRLVKAHDASEGVSLAGFVKACVLAGLREAGVLRSVGRVASVVEGVSGVVEEEPFVPARVVGRRVVRAEEPVLEPEEPVAPVGVPTVFKVKPARVPVGEFDRVSREVVESEWKPAPGLSKAEQAKRGGRK